MSDAQWYVAIGGERVGPLAIAEVAERVSSGDVHENTFVWRHGFPDWLRAREVEEVAALLISSTAAAPLAESAPESESTPEAEFESAPEAGEEGGDGLFDAFESGDEASSAAESFAPAQETGGDESADDMVWARHESSVLFSLDDFSEGKKAAPAPVEEEGDAVTDSGLIDIRAMAKRESRSATAGGDVFAGFSAGTQTVPEMVAPMDTSLTPLLKKRRVGPWVAVALVILAAGAAAAWFLWPRPLPPTPGPLVAEAERPVAPPVVVTESPTPTPAAAPARDEPPAVAEAAPTGEAPVADAPDAESPVADTDQPAEVPSEEKGDKLAEAAGEETDDAEERAKARPRPRPVKPVDKPADKARPAEKPADKPKPAEAPKPAEKPEKKDAAELLAQLKTGKKDEPAATTPKPGQTGGDEGGDTPKKLSSSQVLKVTKKYGARIRDCYARLGDGGGDYIRTRITIAGSGSVTDAAVTSGASGALAVCVVGVLKSMSFPRFEDPSMTVNIPFKVK